MTREEIIRMAREADLKHVELFGGKMFHNLWLPDLERFFQAAYAAGASAERNRLATKLVQDFKGAFGDDTCASWAVWIKEQKT